MASGSPIYRKLRHASHEIRVLVLENVQTTEIRREQLSIQRVR